MDLRNEWKVWSKSKGGVKVTLKVLPEQLGDWSCHC